MIKLNSFYTMLVVILFTTNAWAQLVSPSIAANPNEGLWGTGAGGLVQTCQNGASLAKTIDINEDDDVREARDAGREAKSHLAELKTKLAEIKSTNKNQKSDLRHAFSVGSEADSFFQTVTACQEVFDEGNNAEKRIAADDKTYPKQSDKTNAISAARETAINSRFTNETGDTGSSVRGGDKITNCRQAVSQGGAHPSKFIDAKLLCGVHDGPVESVLGGSTDQVHHSKTDVVACQKSASGLLENIEAERVAQGEFDKAKKDLSKQTSEISKTIAKRKRELAKDYADDKKLAKELGEDDSGINFTDSAMGVRDCKDGTCGIVRVVGASNNNNDMFDKIGPIMLGATLIETLGSVYNASAGQRTCKSYGYCAPQGPNYWMQPAQTLNNGISNYAQLALLNQKLNSSGYGYPMSGIGTGMGNGAFSCAQLVGSSIYNQVGQNGNILGPYSAQQSPYAQLLQQQQGRFNPMMNGQVGVMPVGNGQMMYNQNGQLAANCIQFPCNTSGLGNTQVYNPGVFNGNGNQSGGNQFGNNQFGANGGLNNFNSGIYGQNAGGVNMGAAVYADSMREAQQAQYLMGASQAGLSFAQQSQYFGGNTGAISNGNGQNQFNLNLSYNPANSNGASSPFGSQYGLPTLGTGGSTYLPGVTTGASVFGR